MRSHEIDDLWDALVPASGQADTVQGELVRVAVRLQGEAWRNGNANWDEGFERWVAFLREVLGADEPALAVLGDPDAPEMDEAPWDRLFDAVVAWVREHPEPVPHAPDPDLHR